MPYCRKCGTKLDEKAEYCPVCGTQVRETEAVSTQPAQQPQPSPQRYGERHRGWSPWTIVAIVLIAVLAVALLVGILVFAPLRPVSFGPEVKTAPLEAGIDSTNLAFHADDGRINVTFADLVTNAVQVNVTASGSTGLLAPSQPINFTLNYSRVGRVLYINSSVVRNGWQPFMFGLDIVCEIKIDRDLNASVEASTSVGSIDFAAGQGVILDSLNLEAVTGSVEANLGRNVIVNGPVQVHSTTGSIDFSWTNLKVVRAFELNIGTTTGSVDMNITQESLMEGDVTVEAGTVTGGVNLNLSISDGVGAKIESSTSAGSIKVNATNFSGTKSPIQSNNYPAQSNFVMTLRTTTGGVDVLSIYSQNTPT